MGKNNKKLGSDFEKLLCRFLSGEGYWVHFLEPDARGAQPFDVIAVKDGRAMAIDCKTCKDHIFRLDRLEDNQVMAFEKWIACGNESPTLAVLHDDKVYFISYLLLSDMKKIDLWRLLPKYVL